MKTRMGKAFGKNGIRIISLLLCITLVLQLLGIDITAFGADSFAFQGYDNENITDSTFSFQEAGKNGTSIVMDSDSDLGQAVGQFVLDDPSADISASIDLGGLEVDFSTLTTVLDEGVENDVPTVRILFFETGFSSEIPDSEINLAKADNAIAGDEILSTNASIPVGTRSVMVFLDGQNTNTSSENTVVFDDISLIIHDAAPPTCTVDYDTGWTNSTPITVTVTASDSDSGLEGIYIDDAKVTDISPHTFTVLENTSFSVYSKDYADKTSETQNISITNIDTSTPAPPAAMALSHDTWTNTNVDVTMPALGASMGAPEKYIYQLGESAWQDFPEGFSVTESGVYDIRIAVTDEAGNTSEPVSDIIYIDKLEPSINSVSQSVSSGACVVSVDVSDAGLSGLDDIKYASGSHDAAYFASDGTDIVDSTFTVETGGVYTIFASDIAGNHDIGEYVINTAPSLIDIVDTNVEEDTTINVPINVTDKETGLDVLAVSTNSSNTDLISNIVVNQSDTAISLDIKPEPNLSGGPVTIAVHVEDEQGEVVSDIFDITVLPVNDDPTAMDDVGIETNEDNSVTIDVLANDTDNADGDVLSISDAGTPGHGTATVVDGKIAYMPDADYKGEDSFIYTISDGNGGSATATVSVNVTEVNDPPFAVADTAITSEDTSVLIDVVTNDTDVDLVTTSSEVITLVSALNGTNGTTVIEEGKILYKPKAEWAGKDSFNYTINDSHGLASTGKVTVTVTGVADDPYFEGLNDTYTINEDSVNAEITFSIKDIETAADSLMMQAVSLDETLLDNENLIIEGLEDDNDAVTLKVTPVPNEYGDVTINLSMGDGFVTIPDSFVLSIANVNDAPNAKIDNVYYEEDEKRITIETSALIANDTDIDGDALSFVDINTTTSVGTLVAVDETKTAYYYYPLADYEGTDSFTYIMWDETDTDIGTCNVIASAGNDAPVVTISEESYTTDEDVSKTDIVFSISDKETLPDGLIVTVGSSDTHLVSTDDITVLNNGDGTCTISIDPMQDANGTATVTVTVSDANKSSTGSFKFVINPMPDAPVAVTDFVYVLLSGSQTFDTLLNDRDVDGDMLSVASFDGSSLPGTLTYNETTGEFTYVSSIGEQGAKTFEYTITDDDETTENDTAIVTLNVNSLTHTPQISSIANQYIMEDGDTGNISFSISDIDDGDTFTVSFSSSNTTLVPDDFVNNIIFTDNEDGTYYIRVKPVANLFGTTTITITVTDSTANTNTLMFLVVVYEENDSPIAVNDEITTTEDSSTDVTLDMLSNDSDPEGDDIWVKYVSSPSHGTLTRSGSVYTYKPYGNYNGTETLTYWVTDGHSTDTGTIIITVTAVNDAPIARDNWGEVANTIDASVVIDVLSNDDDVDGDTIKILEFITPTDFKGTVTDNGNGTITYTRDAVSGKDNGDDSFQYKIIDRDTATGDYLSAIATVHIGVDFNSSLYCDVGYISCNEDADADVITLPITNPNDVDYDLTVDEATSLGTFEVIDNVGGDDTQVRFTPALNANGYQTITYSVTEVGGGESDTSYISLRVYPVNDAPVIDSAPDTVSCDEDSSGAVIEATFHDVDCADDDLYFYAYATNASSDGPISLAVNTTIEKSGGSATVTAVPVANASGDIKIVIGVSDGMAWTQHVVDMTVNPVDDAPAPTTVSESMFEDTTLTFSVLTASTDVDGDDVTVSIADGDEPKNGTAVVNGDNTITYTPDENWVGDDSLVFSVADVTEAGLTSTATAEIAVLSINDPPIITNLDYYQTTNEETPKEVTLTVTDVDDDMTGASSYTITSDNADVVPAGNITISNVSGNNMVITLVPIENAYGTAIVNITASDGELVVLGEFQITVLSVNDAPIAQDDAVEIHENASTPAETTGVSINVIANDSDVEDTSPQVVEISNISEGSVVNNKNGFVTYSVDGDFNGTATFDYTVMDKNGATDIATVTVTILPKNDPPSAVNDTATTLEDNDVTIAVLENDSDVEGDTLTIVKAYGCAQGTVTISGTNIIYSPNLDCWGTDSFSYDISDGNGGTATAEVSIDIEPLNDPPTVEKHSSNSEVWQMLEDETKAFNFVVDDAETDVCNLIITIHSQDPTFLKDTNILLSSGVDYKILTVKPVENRYGTIPVDIQVTDGIETTIKTYDIIIVPVNDAPEIDDSVITTPEDTPANGNVTATDPDSELVDLTFSKESDPAHGSVTVNADGSYTYTPDADYSGPDSFDVKVDDGKTENNEDAGTVQVTVVPVNDNPVAVDDTDTTPEDTAKTINVLANDVDADIDYGDELTVTSVGEATNGSTAIVAGGIEYTPDENWNGEDSFTYTMKDSDGKTDSAMVTITVTPVNDAPANGNDEAETNEDILVTIAVTDNDDIDETTNPLLEDIEVLVVDDPANGTAVISADKKSITYNPDENWFGTEVFHYTAQDADGQSTEFSVTVVVNPVNDLPNIVTTLPDNELPDITINEDTTSGAITFTVNDVEDVDSTLSVTVTHNNSALLPMIIVPDSLDSSRSFTITPKTDKNGTENITVTVTDSANATDVETFVLTVDAVNDAPVADNDAATTDENTAKNIDVLANDDVDSNNEGDTLTITGVTTATFGTVLIVEGKTLTYTPYDDLATKENNVETLTYTMKDASEATSSADVTITITPVNDRPEISEIGDIADVPEDSAIGTGVVNFTVQDEEDDNDTMSISVACDNEELFPLANITVLNPEAGDGTERTVQAVPAANKFGTATITLTVRDLGVPVLTSMESFTVTVDSVNDVPTSGDDTFTVVEDVEKELDVLANDDVDYATSPDDLAVTGISTEPTHGTVTIAPDGKSVFYTTTLNSNEADMFEYDLLDAGDGVTYTFTVDITVTPVNDAPVVTLIGPSEYTVNEGVAENDIPFTVTDVDDNTDLDNGLPIEVSLSASSTNYILVLGGLNIHDDAGINRYIDVQPYKKWNGTTTIKIKATDDSGATGTASFTFIVNSVNEAPNAIDDTFNIPEDAMTKVNVLANDTDGDLATNPDTEFVIVNSVVDDDENAVITVSDTGDGVNVQPIANYNGSVSFTYVAEDAQGALSNSATVTITVTQVNDAPVADDDSATTNEDTAVAIDVLNGDTDIDQTAVINADPSAEVLSISVDESDLQAPTHGSIEVVEGKIVYTPSANYNGTDSFEYNVDDGQALDKGLVNVAITQVNDNPIAVMDSATTNEGTAVDIFVLANDTDIDTNVSLNEDDLHLKSAFSITSASVNDTAHGSVAMVGDKLVYTPTTNSYENDVITYVMSDGKGSSSTATVNVTVNSVNDLPVYVTSPEDMSLTEDGADGVKTFIISDVETEGTALVVTVVSSTNTGLIRTTDVAITKGEDGNRTVTVNPRDNQNGTASITLRITDANGGTKDDTFVVTVGEVNDKPIAQNDTDSIAEDTSYSIDWTGITSDVDIATNGDSLGVTIEDGHGASYGTATVVGNDIKYTPSANFNGIDSFTYTVTDSKGAKETGLITIMVTQVNDAPVADDDSATTNEDTAVTIDVLNGDTDVDQNASLNADPSAEVLSISIDEGDLLAPTHGSIAVVEGKIIYTPSANYNGADSFEYNVDDGQTLDKGLVDVAITQVNDNPIAVMDSAETKDEVPVDVNVLANDTDIDTNASLNENVLHSNSTFSVLSYAVVGDAHGTLSGTGGVITYTPSLNFTGTQEISYVLGDGHDGTANGTLLVLVNEENDAPIANDDNIEMPEDTEVSKNVLANDTDIDVGDQLTFVSFAEDTSSLPGEISATSEGVVTFDPDTNYHGSFTIGYLMRDILGLTDSATITFTVSGTNDDPIAEDDSDTTPEDTPIDIDTSGLISDADILTDGDSLMVTVAEADGPEHGTVVVVGTTVTYTPNANWNRTDRFTYTVTDSNAASDTAVITITVTQVNDTPVANNDSAETDEDTPVTIDAIANDTDIDTDSGLNAVPQTPITIAPDSLGSPTHGSVEIVEGKTLYTPDADYNGTDSFTYCATDGTKVAEATVSVTIGQVNDKPVANDDSATTNDEELVIIDVLVNDTDKDALVENNEGEQHSLGDLSVTSVGSAANGTASVVGGAVHYTPNDTFVGEDTFTYTISDGHGGTASAVVVVTVLSVNDAPKILSVPTPTEGERYGGESTLHVTWTAFDIDGDVLTYTLEYYDGSAWNVAKTGIAETAFGFEIPDTLSSITDLQFRVKTTDGQYTSDYGYSGRVSIDSDIPVNIVVSLVKSNGKAYTEGTWTNQSVIVTAEEIEDWSDVVFSYALEDLAYAVAPNQTVTSGVHKVYILAEDEFGNINEFGGYSVRIDKKDPAVPDTEITLSGNKAMISLTLLNDPGKSGNRYLMMPDGSKVEASQDDITFKTDKNGEYAFEIVDNAGNKTEFTVTVDIIDVTPPVITCDSGDYVIGDVSPEQITAVLAFADESDIVARGYAISEGSAYNGIYSSYTGKIVIEEGEHYLHGYAKNSVGLSTYETFGPFIVEGIEPIPSAGQPNVTGDVEIDAQDIAKDAVKVRMPGGEWQDTLVLEGIDPGVYLVEVMDEDGNITVVEVTITDEAVAKGQWHPVPKNGGFDWTIGLIGGLAGLIIILLLLWNNVIIKVCTLDEDGREKVLRTIRKLKRKKDEVIVTVKQKQLRDSTYGRITLRNVFTKRMKENTLVVQLEDIEVLRVEIPEDIEGKLEEIIQSWQDQ